MSTNQNVSNLFKESAKFLKAEFEHIRLTNPHSGEKGEEAQDILIKFLNAYLPKRFTAASGIIIDKNDKLSKQTDVIIYDSFSSPVYRSSHKTQIVPNDSVACVIEVKSNLDSTDLKDAIEKVASCKTLYKRGFEDVDQLPTGSTASNSDTLGIVFGYDSRTKLETLGKTYKEVISGYDSNLWPDAIIVLDKGALTFAIQYPGEKRFSGTCNIPSIRDDGSGFYPPWYVGLVVDNDGEYAFNKLFLRILSHLTFFPRRPVIPPFERMLDGAFNDVMLLTGYQFDLNGYLRPVPEKDYDYQSKIELQYKISTKPRKGVSTEVAVLQYVDWQNGAVLRLLGRISLNDLLSKIMPKNVAYRVFSDSGGYQVTSVIALDSSYFRTFDILIKRNTKYIGTLEGAE